MKIRLPVHAALKKEYIIMKATNNKDLQLVNKIFETKKNREDYAGKEYFIIAELDLPTRKRTFRQNRATWILIEAIFESMEGRKPTEEEKYNLYLDLLEVYAEKVPCRFKDALRPIHISEANSIEGARFIDGLLYHLATECNLDYGTQSTVADVLWQWESYRGTLEVDPFDYTDSGCTELMPVDECRERHPYSEASGRTGDIERAHIASRGSDVADIEKSWNWIALLHDEHMKSHQIGWDAFLQIYPHLRGRVDRARNLAGKLELDFKNSQKAIEYTPQSLAMEALNESSH
jgi:hypothetical protein